jgi:hypothetical protein
MKMSFGRVKKICLKLLSNNLEKNLYFYFILNIFKTFIFKIGIENVQNEKRYIHPPLYYIFIQSSFKSIIKFRNKCTVGP